MSSYNPRERSLRGDKTLNAIVRCGQAVHSAVERFVTLGEALADDNVEIKVDMYEACRDARAAGEYGKPQIVSLIFIKRISLHHLYVLFFKFKKNLNLQVFLVKCRVIRIYFVLEAVTCNFFNSNWDML